jgi:alpha-galactosidase
LEVKVKIVIIGAGSQIFGQRSIVDILSEKIFRNFDLELVLVDTNPAKLEKMKKLAEMVKEELSSKAKVWATTDRLEALPGTDYVFISVSYRRYELWEQDFRVPYAYGFKQAYGENGGPGALFHALRNIHVVMTICKDIERLAPEAFVFNFTNPESRILLAIKTLTPLKAIGLCHGQHDALMAISRLTGRAENSILIRGGGINHLFWLQEIKDKTTGEDLYPELKARAQECNIDSFTLPAKLLQIYGMLTYPDNTHAGEFFSFGTDYMHGKWVHGIENRSITSIFKSEIDHISPILSGKRPIQEILVRSREIAVPLIIALSKGVEAEFYSGNVVNDHLYIPNLQPEGVVEVPIYIKDNSIHAKSINPLPEGVAAFCRTQISIQKLTVMAYETRSKNLLLQALLLEPTVDSIDKAEALIDDMLILQRDYLPEFN